MSAYLANMDLDCDDSMVLQSNFAGMGRSSISVCTNTVSSKDTIPKVDEEPCGRKHIWWKLPCIDHCLCKRKEPCEGESAQSKALRIISDPRILSGLVTEVDTEESGEQQIRVLSHSKLITGDETFTTHGRKGRRWHTN